MKRTIVASLVVVLGFALEVALIQLTPDDGEVLEPASAVVRTWPSPPPSQFFTPTLIIHTTR